MVFNVNVKKGISGSMANVAVVGIDSILME